jgi:HSP20 family molecular chaperone IbpA
MTVANKAELKETTRDRHYISPAVDIFETEEALTLVADMPGAGKEQLEIDVDQGVLTLSARVEQDVQDMSLYQEFRPSGFHRQFRLLEDFDVSKADAQIKNGVLTLRLPKAEAAKPRKITVKTVH